MRKISKKAFVGVMVIQWTMAAATLNARADDKDKCQQAFADVNAESISGAQKNRTFRGFVEMQMASLARWMRSYVERGSEPSRPYVPSLRFDSGPERPPDEEILARFVDAPVDLTLIRLTRTASTDDSTDKKFSVVAAVPFGGLERAIQQGEVTQDVINYLSRLQGASSHLLEKMFFVENRHHVLPADFFSSFQVPVSQIENLPIPPEATTPYVFHSGYEGDVYVMLHIELPQSVPVTPYVEMGRLREHLAFANGRITDLLKAYRGNR
jgi:hypothetical protein